MAYETNAIIASSFVEFGEYFELVAFASPAFCVDDSKLPLFGGCVAFGGRSVRTAPYENNVQL